MGTHVHTQKKNSLLLLCALEYHTYIKTMGFNKQPKHFVVSGQVLVRKFSVKADLYPLHVDVLKAVNKQKRRG